MELGKKIILISGSFGLIILILFYFGIYFLIKDIKKNSEDFLVEKKEIAVVQAKIENLEHFKKTYGDLESDLEKISNLFVDPKIPIDFIKFLETTASSSGVTIEISLTSSKETVRGSWPFLVFQLDLTGSMPNFFKFFEKIEAAPYLIEIKDLSVNRISEKKRSEGPSAPSLGDISATLTIKVFTK